jgi:osmotically-inducible protein OsmY
VNRQINAALGTNLFNPPNVTVKPSNDGSLVLVGSVSTPEEREKVEKIVKSVPDVAVVRNQVKIDQRFVVR